MKRSIASLLIGLALCAPTAADPVMAPANPFASPVSVNACNLEYANENQISSHVSGVAIQFTNNSSRVSDLINFKVTINGQDTLIRDVGTFTPGIEITHKFRTGSDQWALPVLLQQFSGRPPVTCRIESIHFADGTSWHPGGASTKSALTIFPARLSFAGTQDGSRLVYVASPVPATFSARGNCAGIASILLVAQSDYEAVYRVLPRATGYCASTIVDGMGNAAMVPIAVK